MVYKFIAAMGIVALAACSGDKICEPPIPAETSSSSDVPAESSAASSSSMTIESSSSAETASSSSSETTSSSSEEPAAEYFWNDEFYGETIDTSKWTFEIGTGAGGWGNNEWEY